MRELDGAYASNRFRVRLLRCAKKDSRCPAEQGIMPNVSSVIEKHPCDVRDGYF
jgi:hypothetical protein